MLNSGKKIEYKNDHLVSPIIVTKVPIKMDLKYDNPIYEDAKAVPPNIRENSCYREVVANKNVYEPKNYSYKIIMAFVIVFALLLGTAGACVAFAVQITTLKSEIASLQMGSSSRNTFIDTLEEAVHQLNTSMDMLYQQLSQQNDSVGKITQQTNTSIDMIYQQLSQQNASIGKITRQTNTSIDMIYQQLSQQIDSAYEQLENEVSQQLNNSIVLFYQKLSQQNGKITQQTNTSIEMINQQLSQLNDSVGKTTQQTNTSIEMIHQQLSQSSDQLTPHISS